MTRDEQLVRPNLQFSAASCSEVSFRKLHLAYRSSSPTAQDHSFPKEDMFTYLELVVVNAGQLAESADAIAMPVVCLRLPRILWRPSAPAQPARGCGRSWRRSFAMRSPSTWLWFRRVNLCHMQDPPQLGRNTVVTNQLLDLISTLCSCARSLLAAQLMYTVVHGLRGRSGGRSCVTRALEGRVDVCWFDRCVGGMVLLGHGLEAKAVLRGREPTSNQK